MTQVLESVRRWRQELESAGFKRISPGQYERNNVPYMAASRGPGFYYLVAAGKTYRCYTPDQLKSIVVTILLTGDCPK